MKKSINKTKTTQSGYIWIDPAKGKWAMPLIADGKEGVVGYYEICDVLDEDEEKEKEQHERAV